MSLALLIAGLLTLITPASLFAQDAETAPAEKAARGGAESSPAGKDAQPGSDAAKDSTAGDTTGKTEATAADPAAKKPAPDAPAPEAKPAIQPAPKPAPKPEAKPEPKPKTVKLAPTRRIPIKRAKPGTASMTTKFGDITSRFTFGSYARVRAATDLEGGTARQVNVVAHGSRIDESSYAELEFQKLFEKQTSADSRFYAQLVSTLALGGEFFHFTGDFDQTIALRNLYGDMGWRSGALTVSFWAGSRMYRGDDIYLLDFWPMDNLNTVGGGAVVAYDMKGVGRSELKLHGGANRLNNGYQLQVIDVPGIDFGTQDVVFLNRQRSIMSFRFQQDLWLSKRADQSPTSGVKLVLYAEDHDLPEGQRRDEDGLTFETLPAESGKKFGAELGAWYGKGFLKGSFVNLFFSHGRDLAAYGEFGVPRGLNLNETSEGARSTMFALSADIETPYAGLLLGGYYQYFQDADRDSVDFDDYWETTIAARLHAYATDHIHPGVEVSYQLRRPEGPYQGTSSYEVPSVTKIAFIQALRLKKGMYSRPEVRFIYSYAMLNQSARNLYPVEDPRHNMASQHYLGVMVEWWFNNASLFRP